MGTQMKKFFIFHLRS